MKQTTIRMQEKYSIKRAAGWAAAGLGIHALAGTAQAVFHHAAKHYETLSAAFAHVATPENIAVAAGLSAVLGTGIEFIRWHNKKLNPEPRHSALTTAPTPRKPTL